MRIADLTKPNRQSAIGNPQSAEDRWARLGTAASTAGSGWVRFAVSLVVVAVVLTGGLRFFRATERTFADIIRMTGSAIRVANGAGVV